MKSYTSTLINWWTTYTLPAYSPYKLTNEIKIFTASNLVKTILLVATYICLFGYLFAESTFSTNAFFTLTLILFFGYMTIASFWKVTPSQELLVKYFLNDCSKLFKICGKPDKNWLDNCENLAQYSMCATRQTEFVKKGLIALRKIAVKILAVEAEIKGLASLETKDHRLTDRKKRLDLQLNDAIETLKSFGLVEGVDLRKMCFNENGPGGIW